MKASIIRNIFSVVFIVAILLPGTVTSAAETDVTDLSTGISLVKKGNYKEGAALLRKAVEKSPDNPEANYYLGMALNRTSTGSKEAESFLKNSLMEFPLNPGINYELGTHYFEKDIHAEAADYFEQVIELVPGSEMALKSAEYLKKINELKKEKNWGISVVAGGQYDTNVMLNGRDMPLPSGYSGKSDWSAVVNLKADYSPIKTNQAEVGIGYSYYQNQHASLHDFDIMQNLIDLSGTVVIDNYLRLKGVYSFEYLMLNGNGYDIAHTVAPSLIIRSEELGTTTIDFKYRNATYRNSLQFPTNADRNGINHLFGISHILPLTDTAAIWALYSHDVEITQKEEWNYDGNRLLLGLRSGLPFGVVGDMSGEAYWKDYRGVDPQFTEKRRDKQYTLSFSLTKNFTPRYSISLSEALTRNIANIKEFEYDRSMTSMLFNAKF